MHHHEVIYQHEESSDTGDLREDDVEEEDTDGDLDVDELVQIL